MAVAAGAIVLLALRPWRVAGWIWPVCGALLLVAIGNEPLDGALSAMIRQWNVVLFIFGLMGISAAADRSGAFQWIADLVLHRARGSRRRLFTLLFVACSLVTILLSNDATAIALTPVVYRAVSDRGVAVKPFLYASVFVANVASFGLPFSNPANVLILPHARLIPYLWHLGPPELAAIALTLAIFLFFFRRELRGHFGPVDLNAPNMRQRRALYAMSGVAAAYIVALILHWPLGPVAMCGAVLTVAASGTELRDVGSHVSWKNLALLLALFVLLDAVTRAGFVNFVLAEIGGVLRYGDLVVTVIAAAGAALLSNVFNNLPIAVAASTIVAHVSSPQIAYPLIVGVDAGPNLVTSGSLATILWLSIVRGYGVRITLAEYARLGALVVPATIGVSVLWLWAVG